MYMVPIRLDTMTEVKEFVEITEKLPKDAIVKITDGNGLFVNGKSMLGCIYSFSEFNDLYLVSNFDFGDKMEKFRK